MDLQFYARTSIIFEHFFVVKDIPFSVVGCKKMSSLKGSHITKTILRGVYDLKSG
jgi:hypothetical protein